MANGTATAATETEVEQVATDPADFEAQLESWRQAALAEANPAQDEQPKDSEGEDEAATQSLKGSDQTPPKEGATSSETEAQDEGGEAEEDNKPLTRREAHKLAEQRLEALKKSEQETAKLQAQLEEQKQAAEALNREVEESLGTDQQYAELNKRARAGDKRAGEILNQIDANRAFFSKLAQKAQRDVQAYFAKGLVESAEKYGLDTDTLFKGTPAQIVEKAFKAGAALKEEELREELETLKATAKGSRVAQVSRRNGALPSGGKSSTGLAFDEMFNADGTVKEEYIQAARRGELVLT